MKITAQSIVILCEDGSFRNVPSTAMQVRLGERVQVPEAQQQAPAAAGGREDGLRRLSSGGRRIVASIRSKAVSAARGLSKRPVAGIAAAVLFMLVIGLTFVIRSATVSAEPAAMIAIDINPSLELTVDAKGKVKQISLINDDAKWLAGIEQVRGKDMYDALREIIAQAEYEGYLNAATEKTFVLLSVLGLSDPSFEVDPAKIKMPNENYKVELYYLNEADRQNATDEGLTMNKYVVYEQAKQMGVDLNKEELRTQSVVSTLTNAGISPQQFFKEKSSKSDKKSKNAKPVGIKKDDDEDRDDRDKEKNAKNGNNQDDNTDKKNDVKEKHAGKKENRGDGNQNNSNHDQDDEHDVDKKNASGRVNDKEKQESSNNRNDRDQDRDDDDRKKTERSNGKSHVRDKDDDENKSDQRKRESDKEKRDSREKDDD